LLWGFTSDPRLVPSKAEELRFDAAELSRVPADGRFDAPASRVEGLESKPR
jgi:hypothetical protein